MKKHIFCVVLFLAVMATSLCFASFSQEYAEITWGNYVVVDDSNLNVRSGPGMEYDILEEVPYGAIVLSDAGCEQDGWTEIFDLPSYRTGWVRSTLIEKVQKYANVLGEGVKSGYINADDSNVRTGASSRNPYKGILLAGDKVEVYAEALGWYYVYAPNESLSGWIYGDYVTLE